MLGPSLRSDFAPPSTTVSKRYGQAAVCAMSMLLLAGCAGTPSMSTLATAAVPQTETVSAIETYERVARGANRCWFGGRGRYTQTHVLYAEVAPPAAGGSVELVVHERDRTSERPWGSRAFRVVMSNVAGQAQLDMENFRMPEADAARMRREVREWAVDRLACDGEAPAATVAR